MHSDKARLGLPSSEKQTLIRLYRRKRARTKTGRALPIGGHPKLGGETSRCIVWQWSGLGLANDSEDSKKLNPHRRSPPEQTHFFHQQLFVINKQTLSMIQALISTAGRV